MKVFRGIGAAALVATAVVAALQTTGGAHQAKATGTPGNGNIQVVNVSDQSFGVAWTTKGGASSGGSVVYGTACAGATTAVNEVPSDGNVHLANVTGLQPNTTYYYKLVVDGVTDNNNGKCYTVSTYASQARPPVPAAIYGQARHAACNSNSAAPGSLVVLTDGSSGALAAITDSQGRWALPFGDLTDSTGAYVNPGTGSVFTVTLTTDAFHIRSVNTDGKGGEPAAYNGTDQTVGPVTVCTLPAPATVSLKSASLTGVYNGHPHAVTATTDPAGISYAVTYNGSATAPTNAGKYALSVTISDPEWTGSTTGTLTVAQAPLTVTASSASIIFGQAIPAIKPSYSGFVGADNNSVVHGAPACSTTATAGSGAGTYATACAVSGLLATNYSFRATPGTLKVALAQPAISYTGKSAFKTGKKAVLSAKLISTETNGAIGGRTLEFVLGSQRCSASTNTSGIAACAIKKVGGKPGKRSLRVTFAGDQPGQSYDYLGATASQTIKITK